MPQNKILGIPSHLYCEPLRRGAAHIRGTKVVVDSGTVNAIKLREGNLHAAFISPIDYAREGSFYQIISGVAVSSRSANNTVALHFREGIHTISTVAVDPRSVSEIILAKVILGEEFEVEPKVVPVEGSLEEMLRHADAAVLTGDEALRQAKRHGNALDLVEAWYEMAGFPYVFGFWCCRERQLTEDIVRRLEKLGSPGESMLEGIASEAATGHGLPGYETSSIRAYLDSFAYEFGAEEENGVREFLKFAYYHGVLPDVPELNYLSAESLGEESDD